VFEEPSLLAPKYPRPDCVLQRSTYIPDTRLLHRGDTDLDIALTPIDEVCTGCRAHHGFWVYWSAVASQFEGPSLLAPKYPHPDCVLQRSTYIPDTRWLHRESKSDGDTDLDIALTPIDEVCTGCRAHHGFWVYWIPASAEIPPPRLCPTTLNVYPGYALVASRSRDVAFEHRGSTWIL
jgi:hypothetical protein